MIEVNRLLPVLQVGYGFMGKLYLDLLLQNGIPQNQIIVVDRRPEAVEACRAKYPELRCTTDMSEALARRPLTGLNLVNSPEHLAIFESMIAGGVRHIYAEKPVVLASQLPRLECIARSAQTFVTGYLINFSSAVIPLIDLMRKHTLYVSHGTCGWGKDRTADKRVTGGDVEDELTHPAELLFMLIRLNQRIGGMNVTAMLDYLPYVDMAAQQAAHERDESYPLKPVSSSHVGVALRSNSGTIRLMLHSSFVAYEQKREVEVLLSDKTGTLCYKAQLLFDTPDGDIFSYAPIGEKTQHRLVCPSKNKLNEQFKAFLEAAAGGDRDPRLTHLPGAIQGVKFSQAVLESDAAMEVAISAL